MGAYTLYHNKKIKLWKVEIVKDKSIEKQEQKPGQIIVANDKQGLYIKTIDGIIKVIEIQGENAKRMNTQDYLRGNPMVINEKLE